MSISDNINNESTRKHWQYLFVIIKDSNKSPNEKATQTYRLFSEGKKLVEVSIELDLRENEASKYFREFLRLNGQDELYEIYLENKHSLRSLRKLQSAKEGRHGSIY